MRKILLLLLITTSLLAISQDKKVKDGVSYKGVSLGIGTGGFSLIEQLPMYPNGQVGITDHILLNLKYPKEAKEKKIEGRVLLRYMVETDGSIGKIDIIDSVHPLLNEEAKRVIRLMEVWKPAIQKGKPVAIAFEQAFNFK